MVAVFCYVPPQPLPTADSHWSYCNTRFQILFPLQMCAASQCVCVCVCVVDTASLLVSWPGEERAVEEVCGREAVARVSFAHACGDVVTRAGKLCMCLCPHDNICSPTPPWKRWSVKHAAMLSIWGRSGDLKAFRSPLLQFVHDFQHFSSSPIHLKCEDVLALFIIFLHCVDAIYKSAHSLEALLLPSSVNHKPVLCLFNGPLTGVWKLWHPCHLGPAPTPFEDSKCRKCCRAVSHSR